MQLLRGARDAQRFVDDRAQIAQLLEFHGLPGARRKRDEKCGNVSGFDLVILG